VSVFSSGSTVSKEIVDKHGSVRDEAIVADCDQLANKCMRLDTASLSNTYSFLYFHERSDEAIVTYFAAIKVDRLDDRNAFTKRYVNNPGLPQLRLRCDDLIQLLGKMLVTKSGPDTKVTKGRLSYCQQRFICSRWSESGFLNAKSSSAYNELALAGASVTSKSLRTALASQRIGRKLAPSQ
jgi:hypothetical protein